MKMFGRKVNAAVARGKHPACKDGKPHEVVDLNGFGAAREHWCCSRCGYEYDEAEEKRAS